ncbi:MAG: hypothetical protein MUF38_18390 [Anaerolineae bacterium]|jgi:hypothetical protein|nr:hypothetical protein [Anaerolineae bacterium]
MVARRFITRWLSITALFAMLVAAAVPALADISVISFDASCESVTFVATNDESFGNDFSNLTILVNKTPVFTSAEFQFSPFEVDFTFPLNLGEGEFAVDVVWEIGERMQVSSAFLTCEAVVDPEEPETPVVVSGRVCFAPGEVASAVFFYSSRLDIYSIRGQEGLFSLRLTSDELAAFPASAAGDVLIAEFNDVLPTQVSRRTDGNLRIVVGPEPLEGKTYECVIAPGSCALSRSWLPGQEPSSALDPAVCETRD